VTAKLKLCILILINQRFIFLKNQEAIIVGLFVSTAANKMHLLAVPMYLVHVSLERHPKKARLVWSNHS
jgi:hypothetical protein